MVTIILAIAASASTLNLVRLVTQNKKLRLSDVAEGITKYFWKLLGLEIAKTGAYVAALVIAAIPFVIIYPVAAAISFVIAAIVFIILAIHLYLGLLFRYPMMLVNNAGPIESMRQSYRFFKANKGTVFTTAVLILVTFFVVDVIRGGLFLLLRRPSADIFSVLYLIVAVWSFVYIFTVFQQIGQKTAIKPAPTETKPAKSRSHGRTRRRR